MPQPQNYNFGSRRSQILQFFAGVPHNEDPIRPHIKSQVKISFTTYSALNYKKNFKNLKFKNILTIYYPQNKFDYYIKSNNTKIHPS